MAVMRKLVIVGAGALGREVLLYARDMLAAEYDGLLFDGVAGFLDDSAAAEERLRELGVECDGIAGSLVESVGEHRVREEFVYVLAVGNAKLRRALVERLDADAAWANIVHPTAYLATSAVLGEGVVVAPFAFVGANASLGDHVVLNTYASVGHDSRAGACSVLSPYAVVNGNVALGESVFMGTHAMVIPGKTVGAESSLSAGAVVVRDVVAGSFMMGNPARGWRMPEGEG